MRKTSTYARKRRISGHTFNGAEGFNVIQRCRAYTTEPIIGMEVVEGTQSAATKAMLMGRQSYEAMRNGDARPVDFDVLCHVLGVSWLRAIDIAGADEYDNTMLPIIKAANVAMERCRDRYHRLKRWGFDGPAIDEVLAGIEVYETILQASSPAQMSAASERRNVILDGMSSAISHPSSTG